MGSTYAGGAVWDVSSGLQAETASRPAVLRPPCLPTWQAVRQRRLLAPGDASHVRNSFSPAPSGVAVEAVQQRGQCDPQNGGLDEGGVCKEDAACETAS